MQVVVSFFFYPPCCCSSPLLLFLNSFYKCSTYIPPSLVSNRFFPCFLPRVHLSHGAADGSENIKSERESMRSANQEVQILGAAIVVLRTILLTAMVAFSGLGSVRKNSGVCRSPFLHVFVQFQYSFTAHAELAA